MTKYDLASAQIEALFDKAARESLAEADVIEALIVLAVQESLKLRGRAKTLSCLEFELSNLQSGDV